MCDDFGGDSGGGGGSSPGTSFSGYDFSSDDHHHSSSSHDHSSSYSYSRSSHRDTDYGYSNTTSNYSNWLSEPSPDSIFSSARDSHSVSDGSSSKDTSYSTEVEVSHGFSLGKTCPGLTTNTSVNEADASKSDGDDDDNEEEDEGIGEVYGHFTPEFPSSAPSPLADKRHVISRIGQVGHIGQNLALGHRVGILADDTELIPRPVCPEPLQLLVDEDSPMQTDVSWSPPTNAHNFSKITYVAEVKIAPNEPWRFVSDTRQPVLRVYHTDDVMLIVKHRLHRQDYDLTVKLRVRACGELTTPQTMMVSSEWSEEIVVIFVGYKTVKEAVQTTNL